MEPDLEDKIALFGNLEALQDGEDDDDDELFEMDEAEHRAKCKAFAQLAVQRPGIKSRSTFGGAGEPPVAAPRRAASDPVITVPKPTTRAQPEVIVIEDTPQQPKKVPPQQRRVSSRLHMTSNMETTTIPDATKRASSQHTRKASNPKLQKTVPSSSPAPEDSPSTTMGKRKRSTKLRMAPEAQQCFRGLSFYYIPNNDANQARERRITKAREHGAEWVRSLGEATHVIVDADLRYEHIEKILTATPEPLAKVVVNDSYPLECISYKRLLDPSQQRYQVPGSATQSLRRKTTDLAQPSQESEKSLQPKPSKAHTRKGHSAPAGTPPRSDASTQRSTQVSSGHVISESQLGSQNAAIAAIKAASRPLEVVEQQEATPHGLDTAETTRPDVDDELGQCINYLKTHPEVSDGAESDAEDTDGAGSSTISVDQKVSEDDGGSSEGEHQRKKKKQAARKRGSGDDNWQDKFACMRGGTKGGTSGNPNADTIAMLQKLLDEYTLDDDQWRTTSYRRAISVLGQQSTRITTSAQAKQLPGIGDSIADKIEEIVNTGRLRKHEAVLRDPMREVRQLFLKIYDVGLKRANVFINQGYRTLDDLVEKAALSRNQRIGIDHFDDLNTRIPRAEVEALGNLVRRAGHEIDPRVEMLIGGSYRRGSDSSGDVDLIITKKGTTMSRDLGPFLETLVRRLTTAGFLTAGLATSRAFNGNKWHGCCVLPVDEFPGDRAQYRPVWRRIDFLLVPEAEFGGALIYFTGNDLFNRSMRLLANRKGMSLSHRGLSRDILRGPNREKLTEGVLVEGRDEKRIFEILGVKWREPHQRWC